MDWNRELSLQTLSSISTIIQILAQVPYDKKIVLLTQMAVYEEQRFFSDNFGIRHKTDGYTRPLGGLYETLLYDPENKDFISGVKETIKNLDLSIQVQILVAVDEDSKFNVHQPLYPQVGHNSREYWNT